MVTPVVDAIDDIDADEGAWLASAFRMAVMRLTRRLTSTRTDDTLGLSRLSALSTLYRYGPLSPTALAELERVQPPSITRLITALEARDLVTRSPHPSDGRQTIVTITELGSSVVESERQRRAAWLTQQLEHLSPKERRQLADALPILEKIGTSN
jgi:DNA-binding MarR family transcriptional regulator